MLVGDALLTVAKLTLNFTVLLAETASNFVPAMVTAVPTFAIVGLKLLIVGAPLSDVTVKGALLVAVPVGVVTLIVPVVAPAGTVVTNWVVLANVTVAAVPLKLSIF